MIKVYKNNQNQTKIFGNGLGVKKSIIHIQALARRKDKIKK